MAVKSDGSTIRYRPERISIEDIEPDDANARRRIDPAKIEGLAQSMRGVGQLQPVIVQERPPAAGGRLYRLRAGSRRRLAALQLGWTELDAVVMPDGTAPGAADLAALVDNIQREQLTGYEQAAAFKALAAKGGMTCGEIGRLGGVPQTVVSKQLVLIERLAPEIIDQWRAGHPLATPHRLLTLAALNGAAGEPDHAGQLVIWQRVVDGTAGGRDASPAERTIVDHPEKSRCARDVLGKLRAIDHWCSERKRLGEDVSALDPHELVRYLLGQRKTAPITFHYKETRRSSAHKRRDKGERKADLRRASGRAVFQGRGAGAGQVPGRALDVGGDPAGGEGLPDAPRNGARH